MKMRSKKGFTITELAIVIAVIAILAAVLIPTFSGIGQKAKQTAADADAAAIRNEMLVYFEGELPKDYVIQADGFWYTLTAEGLSAANKGVNNVYPDAEAADTAASGNNALYGTTVGLALGDLDGKPATENPAWAAKVYVAYTIANPNP